MAPEDECNPSRSLAAIECAALSMTDAAAELRNFVEALERLDSALERIERELTETAVSKQMHQPLGCWS